MKRYRILVDLLQRCFGPGLTRPGLANVTVIVIGWILTVGPSHSVTEALVMFGMARVRHWSGFHRFFARGSWKPDVLGRVLFDQLMRHFGEQTLLIVIDDTVTSKKGPRIFGIGSHVDAVRSSRKHKVFTFGHCWVTLALVVKVPFSDRVWALPILFRLYRTKKECSKNEVGHTKKTELARQMLDVLVTWTDTRPIIVAADSAYCNGTVTDGLPEHVTICGAMRPDAVLYKPLDVQAGHGLSKGGRPRKRGALERKPADIAKDDQTSWQTASVHTYGLTRQSRFKTVTAQWYRALGTRLLQIVIVECTTGNVPYRVYFSSNPTWNPTTVIETYACRWAIEVFFRDAKQLLGFGDSQAWTKNAVERVAPLIGMLHSVLVLWFVEVWTDCTLLLRPWYPGKKGFSFADVCREARLAIVDSQVLVPCNDNANLRSTRDASANQAPPPIRRVA